MSAKDTPILEVVAGIIIEIVTNGTMPEGWMLIAGGLAGEVAVLTAPSPSASSTKAPIKSTWAATDSYGTLIYGEAKVGGVLAYLNTFDSTSTTDLLGNTIPHPADNQILDAVVVHAVTDPSKGIHSFGSVYINNIEIPVEDIAYTTGTYQSDGFVVPVGGKVQGFVNAGPFANMCEIRQYDGTQTTALDVLPAAYGNEPDMPIGTNFIGNGLVITHFRFFPSSDMTAFRQAFGGALPHNLAAVIRGEKVYDPRTSSTAYSHNPALCANDFLTRSPLNGGCGYPSSIIDQTALIASANVCETQVNYTPNGTSWLADTVYSINDRVVDSNGNWQRCTTEGTSGTSAPAWATSVGGVTTDNGVTWVMTAKSVASGDLYKIGGALDLSKNRSDLLSQIVLCMAGDVVQASQGQTSPAGAQISILSGSWSSPAGEIDESFLAGSVTYSNVTQDQRYNLVKASFNDKTRQFSNLSAPAVPGYSSSDYSTWKAEDGGYEIVKDLTLDLVNDVNVAQFIAQVVARRSRYLAGMKMKCNLRALVYNVGDRVQITNSELGFNKVNFQITAMIINSDFSIDVTLVRDESSIYQATTPETGSYINPPVHKFSTPPTPTGLAAVGTSAGVKLSWDYLPSVFVKGVEIWYSTASGGTYSRLDSVGSGMQQYIHQLANGSTGYYKIRSVNGVGYSPFTSVVSATSGLASNNADVTGSNTSNDTKYVSGTAAATVSQGAGRANAAIDSGNVVVTTGLDFSRAYKNKNTDNIAETATNLHWKASQQTALITNHSSANVVHDPLGKSADFWSGIYIPNGDGTFSPSTSRSAGQSGYGYSMDGRGNYAQYSVDAGDLVVIKFSITTAATGTANGCAYGVFKDINGNTTGYCGGTNDSATGDYSSGAVVAPANTKSIQFQFGCSGGANGGTPPTIGNIKMLIGHQTVGESGGMKANDVLYGAGKAVAEYGAAYSTSNMNDDAGLGQKSQWAGIPDAPGTLAGYNLTAKVQTPLPGAANSEQFLGQSGTGEYVFNDRYGTEINTWVHKSGDFSSVPTAWGDISDTVVVTNPGKQVSLVVDAYGQPTQTSATSAYTFQLRIAYSFDGGSTWSYSAASEAQLGSTANQGVVIPVSVADNGTPSNDIQMKLQAQYTAGAGGSTAVVAPTIKFTVLPQSNYSVVGQPLTASFSQSTYSATLNVTYPTTSGESDVTLTVNANNGTPPYNYSNSIYSGTGLIKSGATTANPIIKNTQTATSPGTEYDTVVHCTVTDSASGSVGPFSTTVKQTFTQVYDPISVSMTTNGKGCSYSTTSFCTVYPSATESPSGGNGSYTYAWTIYSYTGGTVAITSGATSATVNLSDNYSSTNSIVMHCGVNDTRGTGSVTDSGTITDHHLNLN